MKTVLNKELLEAVIADRYVGSRNFEWMGNDISFDYEGEKNDKYFEDNRMLKDIIDSLQYQLDEAQSRLLQSEKMYKILVREVLANE